MSFCSLSSGRCQFAVRQRTVTAAVDVLRYGVDYTRTISPRPISGSRRGPAFRAEKLFLVERFNVQVGSSPSDPSSPPSLNIRTSYESKFYNWNTFVRVFGIILSIHPPIMVVRVVNNLPGSLRRVFDSITCTGAAPPSYFHSRLLCTENTVFSHWRL